VRRLAFVSLSGLVACLALIVSFSSASLSSRVTSSAPAALAHAATDPRLVRLLSALSPHTRFITAVEGDVDRDGDLDVIATTSTSVVLWLNDNRGHFTSREIPARSAMRTAPGFDDPLGRSNTQVTVLNSIGKLTWSDFRTTPASQGPRVQTSRTAHVAPLGLRFGPSSGRAPPVRSVLS
jgi:hypothetical protein